MSIGHLSRREFIGTLSGTALSVSLGQDHASGRPGAAASAERPNIVVILADDLGFSDIGCFGSEIRTPNLDRLAAEGMRLTQVYNCAVCCPTRAALLTGVYPHKAGMGGMNDRKNQGGRPPAYEGNLNGRCVTIAEVLSSAGYRTLMSGKWHIGERRPCWPKDRGFDRYYGLISGASSYFDTSAVEAGTDKVRTMVREEAEIVEKGEGFYMTDAITDNALAYLDQYGSGPAPFFLYVAYTAPHFPLHALPEDIRRYEGKYRIGWDRLRELRHGRMVAGKIVPSKWGLAGRDEKVPAWAGAKDQEWEAMRMAVYAAQIERMDRGIGKILARLRRAGLERNTLVLFLSDNGGCAETLKGNDPKIFPGGKDSYMSYGRAWSHASNTPFRRHKTWLYEGGISAPLVARWPGRVPAGRISHETGHVIDLMPTLLEIAAAGYPTVYKGREIAPLDGTSLMPVLKGGRRTEGRPLFWELFGHRAVRQGEWKLVRDREGSSWELYNIEQDRTERHDLAARAGGRVREMSQAWQAWADSVGVVIDPDGPWLRG